MSQVKQRQSRIPTFTSLEDEAAFWDSHSLGEFEDELEQVDVHVARPLVHRLTVDLDGDRFRRLTTIAMQRGIGPTALARTWVLEALERAAAEPGNDPGPAASPS
jgi:hypothetical protein